MSSDSDKWHEEMAMVQRQMQQQLDALLLGQGRLEKTVTAALVSNLSKIQAEQDEQVAASLSPSRRLYTEATHGAPPPLNVQDVSLAGEMLEAATTTENASPASKEPVNVIDSDTLSAELPCDAEQSMASSVTLQLKSRSVSQQIGKSFKQAEATHRRRKQRLEKIIATNQTMEKEEEERLEDQRIRKSQSVVKRAASLSATDFETYLDSCMGALIVANTLFIGLSLDHKDSKWNAWVAVDLLFSFVFFCEFASKVILHRGCGHFLGPDKLSNLFDATIILIDSVQVVMVVRTITGDSDSVGPTDHVLLIRVLRLMRILRVMRLLRFKQTKTLQDMMQGLVGGMSTLGWAFLLLGLMVYITAVLCRIFFGDRDDADITDVYPQFDSVPRSMFTIFRCAFGDCSNNDGAPLAPLLVKHYGGVHVIGFSGFVFFVTIGFFNIVSATFVDSTMAASAEQFLQKKKDRLENYNLWAHNCAVILKTMLKALPDQVIDFEAASMTTQLEHVINLEFTRDMIDHAVHHDKNTQDALEALDIDQNDFARLSDILDPDHSGCIGVLELVDGLRRLRGEPRRSDVVAVDLMMRSLQDKCDVVLEEVLVMAKTQGDCQVAMEEVLSLAKAQRARDATDQHAITSQRTGHTLL